LDSIATQVLLFGITFIAGAIFLFINLKKDSYLKILLSFSGAFLFGLTILHFLPELFHDYRPSYGIFILIGFSFQIIIEFLTQGIDHGHFHAGHTHKIGIPALVGLFLHALFEATPLSQGVGHTHAHEHFHDYFFTGLILHKLPVAIVFGSMLNHYIGKKAKSFIILGGFALMAPLGLFLSEEISFIRVYNDYFMAIVIGIFLYISTTILFETSENHNFNLVKFISIIFGFGIAGSISFL
jgi:zinc and cadmium transporter